MDVVYHPSENIEEALRVLLEGDIFSVVRVAPLPDSDGEAWIMRLDVKRSVGWREFCDAIDRFMEYCDKNGILCRIIMSVG